MDPGNDELSVMAMVAIASFLGFLAILYIAAMWQMFIKAGQPGWAALIPFYNYVVLLRIAGKPGWWLLLALIPLVDGLVGISVCLALARSFGKGGGFAAGLIFLGFIFFPILGFGEARYIGPGGKSASLSAP